MNGKRAALVTLAVTLVLFSVFLYYKGNKGEVAAEGVEIYQLGLETVVLGGEGSTVVGGYENTVPEGPGTKEIVLGYTCIGTDTMFKEILPSFSDYWEGKTGHKVRFTAGWNMIGLDGVATSVYGKPVQVLILASHANGLTRGYSHTKWKNTKQKGVVYSYPYVFIVRKGNPLNITTYADLARPEVLPIHVDPLGTHGGLSTVFAIYGSALKASEETKGKKDHAVAEELLSKVQDKAITRFSGRGATALFSQGTGDVLITIEPFGRYLAMNPDFEMVIPPNTFMTDLVAFELKKNIPKENREVVDAFIDFLFAQESQEAFVKAGFRSSNSEVMASHPEYAPLPGAWGVEYLGEPTKVKKDLLLGKWLDIKNNKKPKHEKVKIKKLPLDKLPPEYKPGGGAKAGQAPEAF